MKPEHKEFLDELRDSGEINMYCCRPYIMEEFGVDKKEAGQIFKEWIESFE